jgi:hypothetical protein
VGWTLAVKLQLYRQQIKLINVTFVIKHFNSNLVKFGIVLHFGMLFTHKFNKINRKIDTLNRPGGLGKLFAKHLSNKLGNIQADDSDETIECQMHRTSDDQLLVSPLCYSEAVFKNKRLRETIWNVPSELCVIVLGPFLYLSNLSAVDSKKDVIGGHFIFKCLLSAFTKHRDKKH